MMATWMLVVVLLAGAQCSSLVGLEVGLDSLYFGSLDTQSGKSTITYKFNNIIVVNNHQFAYSYTNQLYTFVGYDSSTYDAVLITINAKTGTVVYNGTLSDPPYPYGLQYDTVLSQLFAQVTFANGTTSMVVLNPKTLSMINNGFYYMSAGWWTFISSAYDEFTHTYYALYISPNSENLVGITTLNGLVVMNLTLSVNGPSAYALQYNNNTNAFYVLGFNSKTISYDLAIIDQATGNLEFLEIYNSTNFGGGNVLGMGLDKINNMLSMVYANGTSLVLANINLATNQISASIPISAESVSSMLAFSSV